MIKENVTNLEKEVLTHLTNAWNTYCQLEKLEGKQHPCDYDDFCNGMHECQKVIAMRVARSVEPNIFPIKSEENEEKIIDLSKIDLIKGKIEYTEEIGDKITDLLIKNLGGSTNE